MADRGLDVFEKYDFEVKSTSKGRGVIIADTDKGPRLLKYYIGSGKPGAVKFSKRLMRVVCCL